MRLPEVFSDCLVCATQVLSDDEIFDICFVLALDWPTLMLARCVPGTIHLVFLSLGLSLPRLYFRSAAAHAPQSPSTHSPLTGIPSSCLGCALARFAMALASRRCSSRSSSFYACDAACLAEKATAGEASLRSATSREARDGRPGCDGGCTPGCRT